MLYNVQYLIPNFSSIKLENRRQPLDQILGRSIADDFKSASPQGSGSPGTPPVNDRAAAKRAELRKQEQERRRREAVSI